MSRIESVALCLLATVGASAALASSASALPEFAGPFPNKFTSTSKASTLETVGKTKVKCTADTNAGEVTGPAGGSVTIKFTGCTAKGFACNSSGAASGEIVTSPLQVSLGYVNRETKAVGLDLMNPAGATIAQFQCGNLLASVRGSVIGRITPINKFIKPPGGFKLKFAQAKGMQKPIKFEAGAPDFLETSLNGGPFEPAGLSSADTIKFKALAEIKA